MALLWDQVNPASSYYVDILRGATEQLGVMLQPKTVGDPDQLDHVLATIVAERAQALVVVVDPLTVRCPKGMRVLAFIRP